MIIIKIITQTSLIISIDGLRKSMIIFVSLITDLIFDIFFNKNSDFNSNLKINGQ